MQLLEKIHPLNTQSEANSFQTNANVSGKDKKRKLSIQRKEDFKTSPLNMQSLEKTRPLNTQSEANSFQTKENVLSKDKKHKHSIHRKEDFETSPLNRQSLGKTRPLDTQSEANSFQKKKNVSSKDKKQKHSIHGRTSNGNFDPKQNLEIDGKPRYIKKNKSLSIVEQIDYIRKKFMQSSPKNNIGKNTREHKRSKRDFDINRNVSTGKPLEGIENYEFDFKSFFESLDLQTQINTKNTFKRELPKKLHYTKKEWKKMELKHAYRKLNIYKQGTSSINKKWNDSSDDDANFWYEMEKYYENWKKILQQENSVEPEMKTKDSELSRIQRIERLGASYREQFS